MATTTNYSWTTPDNTAYVKDGASAIRTLGSSVDTTLFTALGGAYPGLRLIKKQTIGSAVSSVSVTSAFSATYENYKVIVTGGAGSTNIELLVQLTGITSGYNNILSYGVFGTNGTSTTVNGSASAFSYIGGASVNGIQINMDIQNPFVAKHKSASAVFNDYSTNNVGTTVSRCASTASATGFTLSTNTGTLTGGTIYVYGYGIS
jgi:hypothetical protein